jgi:hypothetical protein
MADLATAIAMAKEADIVRVLGSVDAKGKAADLVLAQMQAEALEDALAVMNGIARLYTGAMPD